LPISLPSALDPAALKARQERLKARRAIYAFEDRAPFIPIPLMKPLSVTRPRKMAVLSGAIRLRDRLNQASDLADRLLTAALPGRERRKDLRARQRKYGIGRLSKLLLQDLNPDPDHTGPIERILEEVFSLLDSADSSPYPYNDLLFAMFDLPIGDMLDDLLWTPSFPGANPSGLYFNVRNADLLDVKHMGREMRSRIDSNRDLDASGRFKDLDRCAAFFPEPRLRGTTATGEPRPAPRALTTRLLDDDVEFAWQRVGGANPVVLRRLLPRGSDADLGAPLPLASWPKLAASLGDFEAVMEQVVGERISLDAALSQGRLFVADYPEILAAGSGERFETPRIFTATVGLFYTHHEQGLLPVAIRLNEGEDAQVYTPLEAGQEERPWRTAKVFFQVADLIHHEMVTHLLESHFILEGIAIAARRQLDGDHPVAALLHAHLRGVVFNLMVGRRLLLAGNNGMVDLLFPMKPGQWINVLREGYRRWKAEDLSVPDTFTRRGTGPDSTLSTYPFRDDSLLVWDALHAYVTEYLHIFYADSDAVEADEELSAWRRELVEVYGRPLEGESQKHATERAAGFDFHSLADLTELLTGILFTSGPRHAAVNFAQWDYMMFVGNTPASVYAASSRNLSEAETILPTADQIVNQMEVIQLLASRQFGRLGHFPDDEFPADGQTSHRIQLVIRRLQERLHGVGARIDARNAERTVPFPYLHPDRVPNSANV
jgi:arachidonate 15-lipoxygenase